MAEYRVQRSFGGNKRGSKVELTTVDAKALLNAGYVSEIQTQTPAKKTAAKKTSASKP